MNAIPAGRKPNSDMAGISSAHGIRKQARCRHRTAVCPPPPDFGLPPREGRPPQPEQGQRQHEPGSNVGEQEAGTPYPGYSGVWAAGMIR